MNDYQRGCLDCAGVCEFAAKGTIEAMSEEGRSETWKIVAEQSVRQYHSLARHFRRLAEIADGDSAQTSTGREPGCEKGERGA